MALGLTPGLVSADTYSPDTLFAGDYPRITQKVTLISGQNLTRGALLGVITASGKYTLSLSAAVDGSQVPSAVLVDDCNASGGDTLCGVYQSGDFNTRAMTFGTGQATAGVPTTACIASARQYNIYMHTGLSNTPV